MNPPAWAQDLMLDALLWWQETHGGAVPTPELRWRRRAWGFRSSGRGDARVITITAGRERRDQKLVLLHETAHALAPAHECHSPRFWDIAWELYRWARVPIRYARLRERNYRAEAERAYLRSRAALAPAHPAQERQAGKLTIMSVAEAKRRTS